MRQRKWRLRGNRAQVSAVATILGLLLVVSFIANYLATTLPSQMRVNDANHNLLIENQLGRLASIAAAAAGTNRLGAVVTQPLSLGSQGLPPFAPPEAASVGPGNSGSGLAVNFTVLGPLAYLPPGGWPVGGFGYGAGQKCTAAGGDPPSPTVMVCSGSPVMSYNFTNGSHWINAVGGANFTLQYTANWSVIVINTTGGLYIGNMNISGNHDSISVVYSGGVSANVTLYGNWDNISLAGTGGGTVTLFLVGNHDNVIWNGQGSSSSFTEYAFGQYVTTQTNTSKGVNRVFYTGFDAVNASSATCPYGNSATTDSVTPTPAAGGGFVQYNTTSLGNSSASGPGPWTSNYTITAPGNCPFFRTVQVPFQSRGAVAGSFVVHVANNYAPPADIAFDNGAVVYAQPGGTPVMIDGPSITLAGNRLALWVPQFLGSMPSAEGTGIASVSLRLLSVFSISLPNSVFSLSPTTVTIAVKTPFGAAWTSYFNALTAFHGTASCAGPNSACKGPYTPGGPVGTVTIKLSLAAYKASGIQFTLHVATYAVSLR